MTDSLYVGHNTPFPVHGIKRLKKDQARTNPGDRLVSQSAWLNLRQGKRRRPTTKEKK